MKTKEDRIKRLREHLPLLWNSYQQMHDVRERRAKGMIDFLLVISTFLPILAVTLFTTSLFNNPLILFPLIPQFLSIVILLKYFVVGNPSVHWFKLDKNFLAGLDNGNFEIELIASLKQLENMTFISMNEEGKLIRHSRNLILFSLFALVLSMIFILFSGSLYLYFISLILIVISGYIFLVYYKRTPDFSKLDEDFNNSKKLLEDWIKNEK